ncbi:hypothetical protein [Arachnia propionica]|uniref:hypothetical protein n=1 Tax=Arachnia propionica TaxID=1750 RepID=UPI00163B17D3|nr:hypothetical protein [Arachnia propionica]MDO5082458.1 hypothetical protein [Arachnia propionica]
MTPVDILLEHLLSRLRLPSRDERGLSQSTENAILLAGAVTIAALIVTAVTAYVKSRLP